MAAALLVAAAVLVGTAIERDHGTLRVNWPPLLATWQPHVGPGTPAAIVVAVDRSSSMKATDFSDGAAPQTRLDAAKSTLDRFVAGRPDDLVGVVLRLGQVVLDR